MTYRNLTLIVAMLAMAALSACKAPTMPPGSGAIDPTQEPLVSANDTLPGGSADCLPGGDGRTQYINKQGGYCLLLPEGFTLTRDSGLDIFVEGPVLESFAQEQLALAFELSVIGAPGGAGSTTPEEWSRQVMAEEFRRESNELHSEAVTFAGLPGLRFGPVVPGGVGGELLALRSGDTLYAITVYPDRSWTDHTEQINGLWAQLSDSLRFFTPQPGEVAYSTPAEVCPQAEPGTTLVIREREGWCALIPDGWQEDVQFSLPGRFLGGPDIGEFWPGQPPYANITIAYYGPAGDLTLDQQAQERSQSNGRPDLVQRSDLTIAGYPAILLNTQDGPFPDRLALIHANGQIYSVLGQPFGGEQGAAALPELEAAWGLILDSIQFFEPYR